MANVRISVVIPLFNKEGSISEALKSVLRQLSPPEEIIVVDDGSTDGGARVVQQFEKYGVRIIAQSNQGVSSARNKGIFSAQGDYIAFLDADDYWYPNHIEILRALILDFPEAGLLSTAHVICRNGEIFRPASMFQNNWKGQVSDFFSAYSVGLSLVNSTTACVKRNVILGLGGFPVAVRRGEDIVMWVRLALICPMAHAALVTAVYNQDAVNRSDQVRETEAPGSLQFMGQLLRDPALNKQKQQSIGLLFDRIAFFTAAGCCLKGDKAGAIAIRQLAAGSGRWRVALAVGGILRLPVALLQWAKRRRHTRER